MVKGAASPDDPGLTQYWADRRRRMTTPLGRRTLRLLHKQGGRCPHCRDFLLHADHQPRTPEQWEQWIRTTRQAMRKQSIAVAGSPATRTTNNSVSYTSTAYDGHPPSKADRVSTSDHPPALRGFLSRMPGKPARPVLRGEGRGNASLVPD
jgi:hypothetical protein